MAVMSSGRIDICFRLFLKRKATILESAHNLTARLGGDQDVIREVGGDEENRADTNHQTMTFGNIGHTPGLRTFRPKPTDSSIPAPADPLPTLLLPPK